MSVEIAWKQNILVTDFHLLKSLLVVFGFGFSRQNINSVDCSIGSNLFQVSKEYVYVGEKTWRIEIFLKLKKWVSSNKSR
jgi:hypothetical protein